MSLDPAADLRLSASAARPRGRRRPRAAATAAASALAAHRGDFGAGGGEPFVVGVGLRLQRRDPLQLAADRVAHLLDPRRPARSRTPRSGRRYSVRVASSSKSLGGEDDAGRARRAALVDRDEPLRRAPRGRGAGAPSRRRAGARCARPRRPARPPAPRPSASRSLSSSSRALAAAACCLRPRRARPGRPAARAASAPASLARRRDLRLQRVDVGRAARPQQAEQRREQGAGGCAAALARTRTKRARLAALLASSSQVDDNPQRILRPGDAQPSGTLRLAR